MSNDTTATAVKRRFGAGRVDQIADAVFVAVAIGANTHYP
jgi:hypothetical protein